MNPKEFQNKLKNANSEGERLSLLDAYAEELFAKEKYIEAIAIYSQAQKIPKQQNVKAYFAGQIGICHFNAGNDKEALTYLLRSARMFDPAQSEFMRDMYGFVLFHLGSLYEYHGKLAKSLEARKMCEAYLDSKGAL